MRPLARGAELLGRAAARLIAALLHERGARTVGFSRVDPRWLSCQYSPSILELLACLDAEQTAYLLARVFFQGKPRASADAVLCENAGRMAVALGIVGNRESSCLGTGEKSSASKPPIPPT